jgi:5'-3' exoribonuclease 1
MAIPGFFGGWLSRKVHRAVLNNLPRSKKTGNLIPVSSLSFDLNGTIHKALNLVLEDKNNIGMSEFDIKSKIKEKLQEILITEITRINPRDVLILAVDGVAPGAKIQQQRSRREKSSLVGSEFNIFNRSSITPGTTFMIELDEFIRQMIKNKSIIMPPKVIYSSHLVPGEGEHKIMDYYRSGEINSMDEDGKFRGINVLYGLDTDLIMLSLLSPLPNIYLARESDEGVININSLKHELVNLYQISSHDFVVLMFLIGNDFIPHIPSLEGISDAVNIILKTFQSGSYNITIKNSSGDVVINWSSLRLFLKDLASKEIGLITNIINKKGVNKPETIDLSIRSNGKFYYNDYRTFWYINVLGYRGDSDLIDKISQLTKTKLPNKRYSSLERTKYDRRPGKIEDQGITAEQIRDVSSAYLTTVAWTYLYYTEGTSSINQDWSYPYTHGPLLHDLSTTSETFTPNGFRKYDGMLTFNVLQQLIAVLPLNSSNLLPVELKPLVSYNSIIRDLYPNGFEIEVINKKFIDKGIAIIPIIDRNRIINAVDQIQFTDQRSKMWKPVEDYIIIKSDQQIKSDSNRLILLNKNNRFKQKRNEQISFNKVINTRVEQKSRGVRHFVPRQPIIKIPSEIDNDEDDVFSGLIDDTQ